MLQGILQGKDKLIFERADVAQVKMFARMPRGSYGDPKQARVKPIFWRVELTPLAYGALLRAGTGTAQTYVGARFTLSYGKQEWIISHRVAVDDLREGNLPAQFSMRGAVKNATAVLRPEAKEQLLVWLDDLESAGHIN